MVIESIGKYVGAKVVGAICFVASAMALIYFWRHPEALATLWTTIKYGVAWLGVAAALPWISFAVLPWVLRQESNVASAVLLIAMWIIDILMALWLCGWHVSGALAWSVLLLGFMAAGAHNFVICESLARKLEE